MPAGRHRTELSAYVHCLVQQSVLSGEHWPTILRTRSFGCVCKSAEGRGRAHISCTRVVPSRRSPGIGAGGEAPVKHAADPQLSATSSSKPLRISTHHGSDRVAHGSGIRRKLRVRNVRKKRLHTCSLWCSSSPARSCCRSRTLRHSRACRSRTRPRGRLHVGMGERMGRIGVGY